MVMGLTLTKDKRPTIKKFIVSLSNNEERELNFKTYPESIARFDALYDLSYALTVCKAVLWGFDNKNIVYNELGGKPSINKAYYDYSFSEYRTLLHYEPIFFNTTGQYIKKTLECNNVNWIDRIFAAHHLCRDDHTSTHLYVKDEHLLDLIIESVKDTLVGFRDIDEERFNKFKKFIRRHVRVTVLKEVATE